MISDGNTAFTVYMNGVMVTETLRQVLLVKPPFQWTYNLHNTDVTEMLQASETQIETGDSVDIQCVCEDTGDLVNIRCV